MLRSLQKRSFGNIIIKRNENQALELAKYAKNFMENGKPSASVSPS